MSDHNSPCPGSPTGSTSSGMEPIWLGIGSAKPQPRVKQNSMFGHVVDAFDEKSIVKIGEVTPYEKRLKAQAEAQKAKEAEVESKILEAAEKTATAAAAAESDIPENNEAVCDAVDVNDVKPVPVAVLESVSLKHVHSIVIHAFCMINCITSYGYYVIMIFCQFISRLI